MAASTLPLRLHAITYAAHAIHYYDLRPVTGELPPFSAGAHLDVQVGNGMVRQYSLANPQHESWRYLLGIKRDPNSRGASAWIHEHWRVGDTLQASPPRNNFALREEASSSLLLAGGIGITPMLSMAARLQELGRPWQLHYSARSRQEMVEPQGLDPTCVHMHADEEHGGAPMDLAGLMLRTPADAHVYCCGPAPMLAAFLSLASARPPDHVHVERFSSDVPAARATAGFHVELARSKRRVYVAPGHTIVDALRGEGIEVATSCEQGICGACETRVLAGIPDHRDLLLSKAEQAANRAMLICCSGCKGDLLVLDL